MRTLRCSKVQKKYLLITQRLRNKWSEGCCCCKYMCANNYVYKRALDGETSKQACSKCWQVAAQRCTLRCRPRWLRTAAAAAAPGYKIRWRFQGFTTEQIRRAWHLFEPKPDPAACAAAEGTRSATRTWRCTCRRRSASRRGTRWSLASAGRCRRQCASTCSRSFRWRAKPFCMRVSLPCLPCGQVRRYAQRCCSARCL